MRYDKNKISQIFQEYENKELINWNALENELKKSLNVDYKTLKIIINDIYKEGKYQSLCYGYAKEFQCIEFHTLIRNYESNNKI